MKLKLQWLLCTIGIHHWINAYPNAVHKHLKCSFCNHKKLVFHKGGYSVVKKDF